MAKKIKRYKFAADDAVVQDVADQDKPVEDTAKAQGQQTKEEWDKAHENAYLFGLNQSQLDYNNPYDSVEGVKGKPAGSDPAWGQPTRGSWLKSYNLPQGFGAGAYDSPGTMSDGSAFTPGQYPDKPKVGDTWSEADVPVYGKKEMQDAIARGEKPRVQPITGPSIAYQKEIEAKNIANELDYIPGGYAAWLSGDRSSPAAMKYDEIRERNASKGEKVQEDDKARFLAQYGVGNTSQVQSAGGYQFGQTPSVGGSDPLKDSGFANWLMTSGVLTKLLSGGK